MNFSDITYTGPAIDDVALLGRLDDAHRALLERTNGLIAFGGGLHIRGICEEPAWHSLKAAWEGPEAYHRLYPELLADDVPFAQDAFGDQWLLRDGFVIRLNAEDAVITETGLRLEEFIEAACDDPVDFLALELFEEWRGDGGVLEPGMLLRIHPPACSEEALSGVSVVAVTARQRFVELVNLAHAIRSLPPADDAVG